MIVSEIITRAAAIGGFVPSPTGALELELIDGVYREVVGSRRWSFLERTGSMTVSAGTSIVSLLSLPGEQALRVDRLYITPVGGQEYEQLDYLPPREFREIAYEDQERGCPEFWTIRGGNPYLWPTPDRSYTVTVDYTATTQGLVLISDEPFLVPDTYHDILVWGLVTQLAIRQRDHQLADRAAQTYERRLDALRREDGFRQRDGGSRVVDSGFYDW